MADSAYIHLPEHTAIAYRDGGVSYVRCHDFLLPHDPQFHKRDHSVSKINKKRKRSACANFAIDILVQVGGSLYKRCFIVEQPGQHHRTLKRCDQNHG